MRETDLKRYREIEELKKLDKKDLDIEITRIKTRLDEIKKQKMLETRPKPLPEINIKGLTEICETFIDELEKYGFDDDDDVNVWFEEVLEIVYGEHIMPYIHKNYKK